mmetsp:Transcript_15481/g.62318  ORF Transcript_15481/g.62318 Transcript_15481/m.62318 type:complete len:152 (+) Transcript_15481:498-953(+)
MLRAAGFLSDAGFLLTDPQRSAWRSVVSAPIGRRGGYELGMLRAVTRDSMSPLTSPIGEEINRAYALGETTCEFINDTLRAFLGALKTTKHGSKPPPPKVGGDATAAAGTTSASLASPWGRRRRRRRRALLASATNATDDTLLLVRGASTS